MIRLVITTHDHGIAANIGGPVDAWSQIVEIEHPALEAALQKTNDYQVKVVTVARESAEEKP